MVSCSPESNSWLNSPETVFSFSVFVTVTVTPLHLLGAYCIVKKTPGSMRSMKWTLLNFHFWNVVLDLMLNSFSVPIPLFPTPSGVLIGLLSYLGVRPTIQLWGMMMSISIVCFSTTMIFENRFYILNTKNLRWKKFRSFWVLANITFCFAYMIPTILKLPDQEYAKEWVLNNLPCIPQYLYSADIVVPSIDQTIIVISSTAFITIVFGQLITFATIIITQLSSNFGANMLSENTKTLQKKLLKALVWQTGIPVVYLVLPTAYATFSFSTDYFDMNLNNLVANLASLHGLVSTLSIILIHQPYRNTVANWFKKKTVTVAVNAPMFSTNTAEEFSRFQL